MQLGPEIREACAEARFDGFIAKPADREVPVCVCVCVRVCVCVCVCACVCASTRSTRSSIPCCTSSVLVICARATALAKIFARVKRTRAVTARTRSRAQSLRARGVSPQESQLFDQPNYCLTTWGPKSRTRRPGRACACAGPQALERVQGRASPRTARAMRARARRGRTLSSSR